MSFPCKKSCKVYLSRLRYMQVHSTAAALNFVMQLVHVKCKTQNQKLGFHLDLTTQKKLPETHILFQNSKRAFYLNGSVHSKWDPLIWHNPCFGIIALTQKSLGYIQSLCPLFNGFLSTRLDTLFFMGTAIATSHSYTVVTIGYPAADFVFFSYATFKRRPIWQR